MPTEEAARPIDHWSRGFLKMLRSHLTAAQREVCIATGFFTVDGFSLIRQHLAGIRVRILIGFDEKARGDLQGRILAAILHDLSTSSADNRRSEVEAIVERLRGGQLQFVEEIPTENLATKVKEGDHAKIYVVDDQAVIITSMLGPIVKTTNRPN